MLGADIIKQINQALRESILSCQKVVDKMERQEEIDSVNKVLSITIENINTLRQHQATIDADVLEAFRTLVQDIRNFNTHNHEEIIPITTEVNDILDGVPIQTTHHATHHGLGTPLLEGGASDYHPPHYQTMNHNNNDTHVVGAAAQESNDCCCGCILM